MIPFNFPVNSTSLGASAFHILENVDRDFEILPIGGNLDVSSFEPCSNAFKQKLSDAYQRGLESHNVNSLIN
jgi:hypothetical protein